MYFSILLYIPLFAPYFSLCPSVNCSSTFLNFIIDSLIYFYYTYFSFIYLSVSFTHYWLFSITAIIYSFLFVLCKLMHWLSNKPVFAINGHVNNGGYTLWDNNNFYAIFYCSFREVSKLVKIYLFELNGSIRKLNYIKLSIFLMWARLYLMISFRNTLLILLMLMNIS